MQETRRIFQFCKGKPCSRKVCGLPQETARFPVKGVEEKLGTTARGAGRLDSTLLEVTGAALAQEACLCARWRGEEGRSTGWRVWWDSFHSQFCHPFVDSGIWQVT